MDIYIYFFIFIHMCMFTEAYMCKSRFTCIHSSSCGTPVGGHVPQICKNTCTQRFLNRSHIHACSHTHSESTYAFVFLLQFRSPLLFSTLQRQYFIILYATAYAHTQLNIHIYDYAYVQRAYFNGFFVV